MKKSWNILWGILDRFGVNKFIEYIMLFFSLISALVSFVKGSATFFYLTTIFTCLSFFILLYFLRCSSNKEHTLHMLTSDNRIRTLYLLLTYEYLRKSPQQVSRNFSVSRLSAKSAEYKYKILKSEENAKYYDLDCEFIFHLHKKKMLQNHIDILILQPRGETEPMIKYELDGTVYPTKAETISWNRQDKKGFDGLLKVQLTMSKVPEKLTVKFRLKKVYRPQIDGAIIICPFIYVNSLDCFSINLNYTDIPPDQHPKGVSLQMAPYDGSRGIADAIATFSNEEDGIWKHTVSGRHCHAHAIYFMDMHHE